ncbi:MAG: hypothetical protein IRY95_04040, partial [Clostridia bacterium]|nr:hypothetical protein [Clostridia bacterium]
MLATVVGNYPKIAQDPSVRSVRQSLNRFEAGSISVLELEEAFRETVARVVREQEEAGIDLLTDGQIRWEDLVTPLARDLASLEVGGLVRFYDNNVYYRRPRVTGRLWFRGSSIAETYREAAAVATRPVKAVLPGPYTAARLCEDRHYGDLETLVRDLAENLNLEARALAAAGAPLIQFDEPSLVVDGTRDAARLARDGLAVAAAGLGVKTAVQLYFGDATPLLDLLAVFPVDAVFFDAVSGPGVVDRLAADGFPLEVGLGIVDGRGYRLEDVAELVRTVERVCRRIDPARVYVHPSCGLEFLPHDRARLKLRLVAEVAAAVRGRATVAAGAAAAG